MKKRQLIVNADDFGRSPSINQAIVRAHREGILTSASLMVNGDAFEEAVELAREHPKLGVGLHLTLVCGRSSLAPGEIPGLVDADGCFSNRPVEAGWNYFFKRQLRRELFQEIRAQFAKFTATGLVLDHVNGHLNVHLHPVIYGILLEDGGKWGMQAVRTTRDPAIVDWRIGSGEWGYRLSHSLIFTCLGNRAARLAKRAGVAHAKAVFGLLQNSRVTQEYICQLLPRLPAGVSELYSHPCLVHSRSEFEALVSPAVHEMIVSQQIELTRYLDI